MPGVSLSGALVTRQFVYGLTLIFTQERPQFYEDPKNRLEKAHRNDEY